MELGVGCSVVVMKIGKKHMNPFEGLHGGIYASAIDTAAYWSAYCDLPEEKGPKQAMSFWPSKRPYSIVENEIREIQYESNGILR
jgi:acyl-coenzyme A thioesterase PaaI-like protein